MRLSFVAAGVIALLTCLWMLSEKPLKLRAAPFGAFMAARGDWTPRWRVGHTANR